MVNGQDLNAVFPNELCEKLMKNGINSCKVCVYNYISYLMVDVLGCAFTKRDGINKIHPFTVQVN